VRINVLYCVAEPPNVLLGCCHALLSMQVKEACEVRIKVIGVRIDLNDMVRHAALYKQQHCETYAAIQQKSMPRHPNPACKPAHVCTVIGPKTCSFICMSKQQHSGSVSHVMSCL
jgi:hypothetical protein